MVMQSVVIPISHGRGQSKKSIRERRRRQELFEKQNGLCYWCGKLMTLEYFKVTDRGRTKNHWGFATFEHILPKSRGGHRNARNIVLAHAICNKNRDKHKWAHDPIYGKGKKTGAPADIKS